MSCNSRGRRSSKTNRILKVLRESERPLYPKEIALFAKVNHSTTRSYLRRLKKTNEVSQPFPQVYVATTTHGIVKDSVCVHNLVFSVASPGLAKGIKKFENWFGSVKLRVVFGSRNEKVTGFVSCDEGMDLDKYVFVVDKFKSVIFDRLGVKISDGEINVVTFELNKDRKDIRLDGVKCLTVKDFTGVLERIYNKEEGVRSEVKIAQPMSVGAIESLLKGGMTPYQILQSVGLLRQDFKQYFEAQKQTNRLLANLLLELRKKKE